ncbi:MAG TPA: alpha/beta hydrolase [Coleofasciculaceae cyanobacterium]
MPSILTRGGLEIHYEQAGEPRPDRPPVIMLHGLASSGEIWSPQVSDFSGHYHVLLPDFPGHGHSQRAKEYTISFFTEVLAEFMDQLNISKAYLVALSVGCAVALSFACLHPERVGALILEGPVGGFHGPFNPLGWSSALFCGLSPLLAELLIMAVGYESAARLVNITGLRRLSGLYLLERLQLQADYRVVRQLLWSCVTPPFIGKLDRVQAPVLIIRGGADRITCDMSGYLVKQLKGPVALREVPGTLHIVAQENPDAFNRLSLEFLQTQTVEVARC